MMDLVNSIIEVGHILDDQVVALKTAIYDDGIVDRDEADIIFKINDAITLSDDNSPEWKNFMVEAITSHVLADETSPNVIDDDECDYLIEKIGADGKVDSTELALLVNITDKASSCTDKFNTYVLSCLTMSILEDGIIDKDEVDMISTVIYGSGGSAGSKISKEEADFLFNLNDVVSGKDNDSSWSELFTKAISSYVLDDDTSPGVIDADEGAYLIDKICADNKIDDVEKMLLSNIKSHATSIDSTLLDKMDFLGI